MEPRASGDGFQPSSVSLVAFVSELSTENMSLNDVKHVIFHPCVIK